MLQTIKRIAIGASMVASASVLATAPAFAASLTNASVTGVNGTDYYLYKAVDTNSDGKLDKTVYDSSASLSSILQGNCAVVAGACSPAGSPGGNVELFAKSETSTYTNLNVFKTAPVTSLSGKINGQDIAVSSLNGLDWFTTDVGGYSTAYGATNLATKWFNDVLTTTGLVNKLSAFGQTSASAYNLFLSQAGFQKFSHANISYINQDTPASDIKIGLAGHYNAGDAFNNNPLAKMLFNGLQISEVAKVTYNGKSEYKYGFSAAKSGLVNTDGFSHNGNYEVTIAAKVPEPSTMLGLMAVGGLFAASKRKSAKTA